jgi:drug/metabolite transporter (DMT)-like permease
VSLAITRKAVLRLTLATAAWGLSFPTAKAVMQAQAAAAPGHAEWFHAALILFNRMALATIIMLALLGARRRGFTRLELRQGLELGLFGGLGMLLQTDAQNYIAASTSAFFTQFTCVFVPLTVALRSRRMPSMLVVAACLLVMAGCVMLSGVELGKIRLGRGEWETIAGAALFTGQILCLERVRFHGNDSGRSSTVMFAVKGALLALFVFAGGSGAAAHIYTSPAVLLLTSLLAVACTVYAYNTMTHWQPRVTSTQAGLIYATEPVFASAWALFLPGWYSGFAGISYANEHLTWQLFAGGGLILFANLLLIARPDQPPHGLPAAIS